MAELNLFFWCSASCLYSLGSAGDYMTRVTQVTLSHSYSRFALSTMVKEKQMLLQQLSFRLQMARSESG